MTAVLLRRTQRRARPAARALEPMTATVIDSPLGPLLAGATEAGVCLLEFDDGRALRPRLAEVARRLRVAPAEGDHRHLRRLREELAEYFAGRRRRFGVPLDVRAGTPFQRRVWQALCAIPFGASCSYEELAARTGAVGAQRAAGQANGRNCIAIVIPCHRVINKSGRLGGYGGELWRKEFLLRLEGATPDQG